MVQVCVCMCVCVSLYSFVLLVYILASIRHLTVKAVDVGHVVGHVVGRVVAVAIVAVVAVTDASSRPHFTRAKCY